MILHQWAKKWGIPAAALADLIEQMVPPGTNTKTTGAESAVQMAVRIKHQEGGGRLWRNNVGAILDGGRMIRYGLCNDSKAINQKFKSSDLIGITPIRITPDHVGGTAGIFTSYEVKKPGWKYRGTGREVAQLAWLRLVVSLGGIGKFSTGDL